MLTADNDTAVHGKKQRALAPPEKCHCQIPGPKQWPRSGANFGAAGPPRSTRGPANPPPLRTCIPGFM